MLGVRRVKSTISNPVASPALEDMMKSDLKDTKKSDEGDQNKQKETEIGVRSCPILEKGLKEIRQQKAS
jgi:hypothetical protein